MRNGLIKFILATGCAFLAACAVITVNVYFPEKAVKDAYKSVDEMLLKGGDKEPGSGTIPGNGREQPEGKPQSFLSPGIFLLALVPEAHAADTTADDLAVELADMPEVVKAYDDMNRQFPRLTTLFASGAIGLTSQGLVTVRDKARISAQDEAVIKIENASRKTVVYGMAKAILKINKQKESKEALDQVMGKAAATYAELKREKAGPGWWIQLPAGRWVQK